MPGLSYFFLGVAVTILVVLICMWLESRVQKEPVVSAPKPKEPEQPMYVERDYHGHFYRLKQPPRLASPAYGMGYVELAAPTQGKGEREAVVTIHAVHHPEGGQLDAVRVISKAHEELIMELEERQNQLHDELLKSRMELQHMLSTAFEAGQPLIVDSLK